MRTWIATVLALAFASCALAQVPDKAALEAKKKEKLDSPYAKVSAWKWDLEQACAEAKSSGKLIFAYFNRSYAG